MTKADINGYPQPQIYTTYNNEIFMMQHNQYLDSYIFIKFNGTAFTQVASEKFDDAKFDYEKMMSYDNNLYVSCSKPYNGTYLYITTDFKTFTNVASGDPLCVYNNDLYTLAADTPNVTLWKYYISTLSSYYNFYADSSQPFGSPKNIINGVKFCDDNGNVKLISYGGLVPANGDAGKYDFGGTITNCIGSKYYIMDSDMYEYTLNLKYPIKPNTLILYEYGNNGRNQINLYTDKYTNLKLGFNRAFYYGQSGMIWDVEIYVPYNNKWLKVQNY